MKEPDTREGKKYPGLFTEEQVASSGNEIITSIDYVTLLANKLNLAIQNPINTIQINNYASRILQILFMLR